jgi:hypothetical protein
MMGMQLNKGGYNGCTFIFLIGLYLAIGVVYPILVITGIIKDK